MERFVLYDELATSRRVAVFKGRQKRSLEWCAVKRYDIGEDPAPLAHSVAVLRSIASPNVLRLLGWYTTARHSWLVVEFCGGGSLEQVLCEDGPLPEQSVRLFAVDVLSGLAAAHAAGVFLRVIRPCGLLLDEHGNVKISEVAWAVAEGSATRPAALLPAAAYVAPELLRAAGSAGLSGDWVPALGAAADLWSFGCLLVRMATGLLRDGDGAAPADSPGACARGVAAAVDAVRAAAAGAGGTPQLRLSAAFADLVARLLSPDPAARPSWTQLTQHAWWAGPGGGAPASLSGSATPQDGAPPSVLPGALLQVAETLTQTWARRNAGAAAALAQPLSPVLAAPVDSTDTAPRAEGSVPPETAFCGSAEARAPPLPAYAPSVASTGAASGPLPPRQSVPAPPVPVPAIAASRAGLAPVAPVLSAPAPQSGVIVVPPPPLPQPPLSLAAPLADADFSALSQSIISAVDETVAVASVLVVAPTSEGGLAAVSAVSSPPPTAKSAGAPVQLPPLLRPQPAEAVLPAPVVRAIAAFLHPGLHMWRPLPPLQSVLGRPATLEVADAAPSDAVAARSRVASDLASIIVSGHAAQAATLVALVTKAASSAPLCDAAATAPAISVLLRLVQRSRSAHVRALGAELCATVFNRCSSLTLSGGEAVSYARALVASVFMDTRKHRRGAPTSVDGGPPVALSCQRWTALAAAEFLFCAVAQFSDGPSAGEPASVASSPGVAHTLVSTVSDFVSRAAASSDPVVSLVAIVCCANVAAISPPSTPSGGDWLFGGEKAGAAGLACALRLLTDLPVLAAEVGDHAAPLALLACAGVVQRACCCGSPARVLEGVAALARSALSPSGRWWSGSSARLGGINAALAAPLIIVLLSYAQGDAAVAMRSAAAGLVDAMVAAGEGGIPAVISAVHEAHTADSCPVWTRGLALLVAVTCLRTSDAAADVGRVAGYCSALPFLASELSDEVSAVCIGALCGALSNALLPRDAARAPASLAAALQGASALYAAAADQAGFSLVGGDFCKVLVAGAHASLVEEACEEVGLLQGLGEPPATARWLNLATAVLCDFVIDAGSAQPVSAPIDGGANARRPDSASRVSRALADLVPAAALSALVGCAAAAVNVSSGPASPLQPAGASSTASAFGQFFGCYCRCFPSAAGDALVTWTPASAALFLAAHGSSAELSAALGDLLSAAAGTSAESAMPRALASAPPARLLAALAHLVPLAASRAAGVRWLRGILACARAAPRFASALASPAPAEGGGGGLSLAEELGDIVAAAAERHPPRADPRDDGAQPRSPSPGHEANAVPAESGVDEFSGEGGAAADAPRPPATGPARETARPQRCTSLGAVAGVAAELRRLLLAPKPPLAGDFSAVH